LALHRFLHPAPRSWPKSWLILINEAITRIDLLFHVRRCPVSIIDLAIDWRGGFSARNCPKNGSWRCRLQRTKPEYGQRAVLLHCPVSTSFTDSSKSTPALAALKRMLIASPKTLRRLLHENCTKTARVPNPCQNPCQDRCRRRPEKQPYRVQ